MLVLGACGSRLSDDQLAASLGSFGKVGTATVEAADSPAPVSDSSGDPVAADPQGKTGGASPSAIAPAPGPAS
ncbi:MAG TPA: hypothetical protein VGL92_12700, partial [Acidimicrobiia bacterium]